MVGRRSVLGAIVVVAMAGLVGAACSGGGGSKATSTEVAGVPAGPQFAGAAPRAGPTPAPNPGGFQLPEVGARIIKTASVTLDIKDGTFQQQAQQVTLVASRHGGFVA